MCIDSPGHLREHTWRKFRPIERNKAVVVCYRPEVFQRLHTRWRKVARYRPEGQESLKRTPESPKNTPRQPRAVTRPASYSPGISKMVKRWHKWSKYIPQRTSYEIPEKDKNWYEKYKQKQFVGVQM